MIISYDETTWVSTKLDTYDIKYQEIYDELKDHLLTAIENLRAAGDDRAVDVLFAEVVQQQFPGYWPFEDIVKQYQRAYSDKISQALWGNFRAYLNWQTIPLILLLMISGSFLPHNKPMTIAMTTSLFLVSVIPMAYFYINTWHIKTEEGRQSLVKGKLLITSNVLMWVCNLVFNCFRNLGEEWKAVSFIRPSQYSPVVFMLMLSFFIVYGLSCLRLCQQELKIAR